MQEFGTQFYQITAAVVACAFQNFPYTSDYRDKVAGALGVERKVIKAPQPYPDRIDYGTFGGSDFVDIFRASVEQLKVLGVLENRDLTTLSRETLGYVVKPLEAGQVQGDVLLEFLDFDGPAEEKLRALDSAGRKIIRTALYP